MILRDAKAIKLGTTTINKIYSGTYKVYDKNKTALEGYCIQNGEPTPDTPIAIDTMKGRQTINVKGTDYIVDLKSKNLLPTNESDWEQGTFSIATGATNANTARLRTKQYYEIEYNKTYYLSLQSNDYYWVNLFYYDKNKNYINCQSNYMSINNLKKKKITISDISLENVAYMRPVIKRVDAGTMLPSEISTIKPQIEVGESATAFEQYYNYELAGIDEYKDSIYTREGKWYKGSKISKVILDGSESGWENANTNLFNVANIIPKHLTTWDVYAVKSSHYYGGLTKDTNQKFLDSVSNYSYACGLHSNGTTIRFKDTRYTDKAQLQTWLASNNVTLYYVLNTPTEEQITAPGLIAQLNALYQAM